MSNNCLLKAFLMCCRSLGEMYIHKNVIEF